MGEEEENSDKNEESNEQNEENNDNNEENNEQNENKEGDNKSRTPTKEEYIAINDDGKIIEDIEKLLDDIKRSRISVVTKLVQTEGIQSYIISNANLNEAMCMCGESMQTYKKKQCDKLNKHSEIKKIEECAKL